MVVTSGSTGMGCMCHEILGKAAVDSILVYGTRVPPSVIRSSRARFLRTQGSLSQRVRSTFLTPVPDRCPVQEQVLQLVRDGHNVFFTGNAGTGERGVLQGMGTYETAGAERSVGRNVMHTRTRGVGLGSWCWG